jgi:aminomethyltransferase
MGLDRLVHLDKGRFIGKQALIKEARDGPARRIVGVEIDWTEVERLFEAAGLPPAVSPVASRVAVPIYKNGSQIGKATSTTWSPLLKRMIALATVKSDFAKPGTKMEIEITVEAVRYRVGATVAKTPFYNPKHKTATPIS